VAPRRDDPRLITSPAGATAPDGGTTTPAPTGPDTHPNESKERTESTTRAAGRRTVPLVRPSAPATVTATVTEPTPDQAIMHARLAAMAAPRDSDDAQLAALRAVLRDERLMAHVTATVDGWPPLTDEQRDTVAALVNPSRRRT
jgi:cytoskeletal protein RodZ